ncbi:MAG: ATP-binding cassette domain-containing protein [Alphaproteobacteria bacterium]|nr:ATP-binding cassette domain-containing protein [Alphaproteobacteria bacterium]
MPRDFSSQGSNAAAAGYRSLVEERPNAVNLSVEQGRIEFRNVTFAYPGGKPVLDDVSFTIEPGERVAIAGASGAGKSTLIALMLRLHDPISGQILVDGSDVKEVTLESLRSAIAVVFQEPYLMRGSIAGKSRSRSEIPSPSSRSSTTKVPIQSTSYGTTPPDARWRSSACARRNVPGMKPIPCSSLPIQTSCAAMASPKSHAS